MDKTSKQLFDSLVAKAPHELLASDIEFLKARVSYLTADQLEKFAAVLGTKAEKKSGKKAE